MERYGSQVVSESTKTHTQSDVTSCLPGLPNANPASLADLDYMVYPAYLAKPAHHIDLAYLPQHSLPY